MSDPEDLARIEAQLRSELRKLEIRKTPVANVWLYVLLGMAIGLAIVTIGFFAGLLAVEYMK
jgi:hypothetical protein